MKVYYFNRIKKIALQNIVSDGTSTIWTLLRHVTNYSRGCLNPEIPEPNWLANLSRRTKVVTKLILALAYSPKIKSLCTKVDILRVKSFTAAY